jgi:hypothetical protein
MWDGTHVGTDAVESAAEGRSRCDLLARVSQR